MSDKEFRRHFTVFIAYAADVDTECEAVAEAVRSVNEVVAPHLGIHFRFETGRDQSPGLGRPQGLINPMVETCDVFIGLLWKRWGQETGEASSGFQEEYGKAMGRCKETGAPRIWIALKRIPAEAFEDAGPQLQKMRAFREELKTQRELLYHEFQGVTDLKERVRIWLEKFAFENQDRWREGQSEALSISHRLGQSATETSMDAAQTGEVSRATNARRAGTVSPELQRAASAMAGALMKPDVGRCSDAAAKMDTADFLRIRLFTGAWLWSLGAGGEIGIHEVNALYQNRLQIDPIPPEDLFLFSRIQGDADGVIPGWFWFQDLTSEDVTRRILHAATSTPDAEVRASAIGLLGLAGMPLDDRGFDSLLRSGVTDESGAVARAFISILSKLGNERHLPDLEKEPWVQARVSPGELAELRLNVLERCNPSRMAAEISTLANAVPEASAGAIRRNGESIPAITLFSLLSHQNAKIRVETARELLRRRLLTQDNLRALTQDSSSDVRAFAYQALIRSGVPISPAEVRRATTRTETTLGSALTGVASEVCDEDVLLESYGRMSADELIRRLHWLETDGQIMYLALGLWHFDKVAERVRKDIADGFASLSSEYGLYRRELCARAESLAVLTGELIPPVEPLSPSLEEHLRKEYTVTALAVLAMRGEAADIVFARQFAGPRALPDMLPVIKLLERFGDNSDAPALTAIAMDSLETYSGAAARAALRLDPGPTGCIQTFLRSSSENVHGLALLALKGTDKGILLKLVEPLLLHRGRQVRTRAVALLGEELEHEDLLALMQRYRAEGWYFYDVGVWLDRLLYAPEALRAAYRTSLASILRQATEVKGYSAPLRAATRRLLSDPSP